jgi:hypothetical protein
MISACPCWRSRSDHLSVPSAVECLSAPMCMYVCDMCVCSLSLSSLCRPPSLSPSLPPSLSASVCYMRRIPFDAYSCVDMLYMSVCARACVRACATCAESPSASVCMCGCMSYMCIVCVCVCVCVCSVRSITFTHIQPTTPNSPHPHRVKEIGVGSPYRHLTLVSLTRGPPRRHLRPALHTRAYTT